MRYLAYIELIRAPTDSKRNNVKPLRKRWTGRRHGERQSDIHTVLRYAPILSPSPPPERLGLVIFPSSSGAGVTTGIVYHIVPGHALNPLLVTGARMQSSRFLGRVLSVGATYIVVVQYDRSRCKRSFLQIIRWPHAPRGSVAASGSTPACPA